MQYPSLFWSFKHFFGLSLTIELKLTKLHRQICAYFQCKVIETFNPMVPLPPCWHRLLVLYQLIKTWLFLGLQSLSLLKNRTYTLNETWSDGMIAAHEPYLLTLNRTALVLWNRRKPEPFPVSKEAHVQKMIILAENLEVPGKSSPGGFS